MDNPPNAETFALQTGLAAAEGDVPHEPLGAVESGLDDRLDEVGDDASDIVVWLEHEGSLEGKDVSASARIAQVLGRARGDERPRRGEVAVQQRLVRREAGHQSL